MSQIVNEAIKIPLFIPIFMDRTKIKINFVFADGIFIFSKKAEKNSVFAENVFHKMKKEREALMDLFSFFTGPFCSGIWQYALLPLVVTGGLWFTFQIKGAHLFHVGRITKEIFGKLFQKSHLYHIPKYAPSVAKA